MLGTARLPACPRGKLVVMADRRPGQTEKWPRDAKSAFCNSDGDRAMPECTMIETPKPSYNALAGVPGWNGKRSCYRSN